MPACHSSSRTISSSRELAAEPDRLGGAPRDPRDLVPGLLDRRRAVDAEHRAAAAPAPAKPAIIPACVEPVTEQTTIVSKKTPSSRSCSATSSAQRAKPSPPSGWSDAPAGIAYGLPPRSSTSASACSQLGRKPMSKPAAIEPDVGAHDPREQDVPDLVVDGVRPVDPVLLHEDAARARGARRRPRPGACGSTGRRRSRRACRSPARARRRRGTRACAPCCRRRRGRSCSPRASPRSRPAPPRCSVSRSSRWTGDGPKSSGTRSKSAATSPPVILGGGLQGGHRAPAPPPCAAA